MKYIKKLIRNSKRALNQQVIKKKQEIVKYAPRLTGIQAEYASFLFRKGGLAFSRSGKLNRFLLDSEVRKKPTAPPQLSISFLDL